MIIQLQSIMIFVYFVFFLFLFFGLVYFFYFESLGGMMVYGWIVF